MKQFFAPISKINEKTREVEGYLALEQKDKEGEIMDYDSSKKYFEQWSQGIQKASGGKSVGNLREMHRPFVAGKFTALTFEDENKRIHAVAKVSADSSWEKVKAGELNGFSIYGDVIGPKRRDPISKARRYTVKPFEGSLVDNPCMYDATFTRVTENGEEVIAKFLGNKDVSQYWNCNKDCDLYHKTKSEALHCEGMAKTQVADDSEELEDIDLDEDYTNIPESVSKGMYEVSSLANNIASLKYLEVGTQENKTKFKSAIKSLFSVLTGMVKAEKDTFLTTLDDLNGATNAVKAAGIDLLKGEEEMTDKKKFADMDEDELVSSLEEQLSPKIAKTVAKQVGSVIKTVLKEAVDDILSDVQEDIQHLSKAVQKMAGQPKPSRAVTKQVDSDDEDEEPRKAKKSKSKNQDDEENELSATNRTSDIRHPELLKAMKSAMRNPVSVVNHYNDEAEEEENSDDDEE